MSRQQRRMASFVTVCVLMLGTTSSGAWAGGPNDKGKDKEISLVNISKLTVNSASAFHRVAVSRKDPDLVAIAWRDYGLPINTNAGAAPGERTADCHVSVSKDGGKTFHDTNLMPFLRQNTGDPELPTDPARLTSFNPSPQSRGQPNCLTGRCRLHAHGWGTEMREGMSWPTLSQRVRIAV